MNKAKESTLAQAIQAYVWGFGKRQTQAGFILQQINGPWRKKKDFILNDMTRAMNDDDEKVITYTPDIVYAGLKEEAIGWNGDDNGVALVLCYEPAPIITYIGADV